MSRPRYNYKRPKQPLPPDIGCPQCGLDTEIEVLENDPEYEFVCGVCGWKLNVTVVARIHDEIVIEIQETKR